MLVISDCLNHFMAWDKIFQYCTCPAGRVNCNFHLSCKHMHMSFKSVCNKEHKGVIWLPRVILPKALVLQDKCFGKNYSSFLDFTGNYERTSGIFVPCLMVLVLKFRTQVACPKQRRPRSNCFYKSLIRVFQVCHSDKSCVNLGPDNPHLLWEQKVKSVWNLRTFTKPETLLQNLRDEAIR